ncbi:GATA transcription factor 24-like isoform X2 [Telopea speciosissima]|nr:GATA transcription factor 24-like isoform X2 [Telopea speciosissima]
MPEKNEHEPLYELENHMQSMNHTSQIEEEDDGAGGESIDNPHIRFEAHSLEDGGVGGSVDVMDGVEEVPQDSTYIGGAANFVIPSRGEGMDQLTLSFQGEVYVFDSVSPEKVQAVLLLLGGYEMPSGVSGSGMASPPNQKSLVDYPRRSTLPQREASLHRFRAKRKERNFDKKIRYNVRKEVALRMQRKKGQFTSSKVSADDAGSASNWNGTGQDDSQQETLCTHCSISSKSTPMMRRGPSGPRTLCNACGLMWANKGTLRDLSRTPIIVQAASVGTRDTSANLIEQAEVNGSDVGTSSQAPPTDVAANSNGNNSAVTAEHTLMAAAVWNRRLPSSRV